MKKIIALFLFIFLGINQVNAISARNIIVMDLDTNRVLYQKDINDPHLIASITKIMTAIVALELADLEEEVTATKTVLQAFGSAIYVEVGETLKLKDLLYGLMLRSGNDAALMIAEYVGTSVDNFVKLMNSKAQEIGMKNTNFINPHGLEDKKGNGNTSTAYDMAILTSYAMKNDNFREIFSTKNYTCQSSTKSYSWTNKNKLLTSYEYTTGGKTGFTEKARRTLVSTASKDNKNIVVVSLNDPDDWADHKTLYNQIFENYEKKLIIAKDNFTVENENYYKTKLYLKEDISILLTKEEEKNINLDINLKKIPNPKNGECVGQVAIKLNDNVLKTANIYIEKQAEETKPKSLWQKILGWFKHD